MTLTRFIILIAATLLLAQASCSPRFAPTGEAVAEPRLAADSFITFDGAELPLRKWLPPAGEARAVIVALHGFNDYGNFIARNTVFFNDLGVAVYAYDQRGFGDAPFRGRWGGTMAMARDLTTIIPLVQARHPGAPLYLLGDSMGGAVVMVAISQPDSLPVEGVILVAPALWARAAMPFYQRWLLEIVAHLIPWGVASGRGLEITPSDNEEMLRELGRDPLVIKESRFDTLYGLVDLMDAAYGSAVGYKARTLVLYGRRDEIIPRAPVLEAFHRFQGQQRFVLYENGYHMLLRDLQAETVMEDIAAWLENPAIPVFPSAQRGAGDEVVPDDQKHSRKIGE